jgi:hypothetical protein
LTSSVELHHCGFTYNPITHIWTEEFRITNMTASTLNGEFDLVIIPDPRATESDLLLINPTGTVPAGRKAKQGLQYIHVSISSLAPGATITLNLQFRHSNPLNFRYQPILTENLYGAD